MYVPVSSSDAIQKGSELLCSGFYSHVLLQIKCFEGAPKGGILDCVVEDSSPIGRSDNREKLLPVSSEKDELSSEGPRIRRLDAAQQAVDTLECLEK